MVPQGYENAPSTTNRTQTTKGPADSPQRSQLMPSTTHSPLITSVQLIRKQFTNTGVSAAAQDVIMASWRQGTPMQCKTFLAKWEHFCENNKTSPPQATVED